MKHETNSETEIRLSQERIRAASDAAIKWLAKETESTEARVTVGNKILTITRDHQVWSVWLNVGTDARDCIYDTKNSHGAWAAYTAIRNALEIIS